MMLRTLCMDGVLTRCCGLVRRGLVGGDLEEDLLEAHAHRPELEQPPAAGDDRAGDLPAHVGAAIALDLDPAAGRTVGGADPCHAWNLRQRRARFFAAGI